MRFLVLTHVLHKSNDGKYFGYGPYIREMNIWIRYFDDIIVVAPLTTIDPPNKIDIAYAHNRITFLGIPQFDLLSPLAIIRSISLLPLIAFKILKGMNRADHIHLRCPGNVGLIGSIVQILFPNKKKTAKYASNWDWNSRQP